MQIPSIPAFPNASLPELVWVVCSLVSMLLAIKQGRLEDGHSRTKLKNGIRFASALTLLGVGLMAMTTPPPASPTWLSVFTPLAISLATAGMATLSLIDEQRTEAHPSISSDELARIREALAVEAFHRGNH